MGATVWMEQGQIFECDSVKRALNLQKHGIDLVDATPVSITCKKEGDAFMQWVQTLEEIRENMQTLDRYLAKGRESGYSDALELVKNGICFIAINLGQGYRFYPSRFIGYAKNTIETHKNNRKKDGRKTNDAISRILHEDASHNSKLECAYKKYCENLGFDANEKGAFGIQRKYWRLAR